MEMSPVSFTTTPAHAGVLIFCSTVYVRLLVNYFILINVGVHITYTVISLSLLNTAY